MRDIDYEREKQRVLLEIQNRHPLKYEVAKICPKCGGVMKYAYGEMFECESCGEKELSDFGKVRQFLDLNGPQNADTISRETGVDVKEINQFLREGRVEIPDGSDVYIRCQSCGTDIRYGRYCPECMMKITKGLTKAMWLPEVGEKPTKKGNQGKMHLSELQNDKNMHKGSAFAIASKVEKKKEE